jgi:Phage integrase family
MTTANTSAGVPVRPGRLSAEASALREKFPPRPVPASWEATSQDRAMVVHRLLAPPFSLDNPGGQYSRRLGLLRTLDWLQSKPGGTWQERWIGSGANADGRIDWRAQTIDWLKATGRIGAGNRSAADVLGSGLLLLICGDVIRPDVAWMLTSVTPAILVPDMARARDVAGFAALTSLSTDSPACVATTSIARHLIAVILAAKGGCIADITVGDCLDLLRISARVCPPAKGYSPYFYQLLHAMGVFPASAPPTVRMFSSKAGGQLTAEQLIDRYDIACRPVRDLLVDYLRERQPAIDYSTLTNLAFGLGLLFWKDLENHHPGIDSLRLAPDVAVAWKQRVHAKTTRSTATTGEVIHTKLPRSSVASYQTMVRAFYLDIAQWAADDPARWGPWTVPCPIRAGDIQLRKETGHRKSRMDQRTRERLPGLPILIAAVGQARKNAAELLEAARRTPPGEAFTAAGQTLQRCVLLKPSFRIWVQDPGTGVRRDLSREEDKTFWTWAAVAVLSETGIRIEELTELSHHSLVQYQLPATSETVPLLHIAPSKTDEERLLVVGPELADVLSAILCRIRGTDGAVPLAVAYDTHECVWNPPMPLLFQHLLGVENRPISASTIRDLLSAAMPSTGLTDNTGKPLTISPHDFRRIFVTDAVMNGMPPHIAQLICGHRDINTTMGYKAVYPEEVINGHRAFIARRRDLRPSEEYRTPTDEEWEEFLGHFERRRVALGDCGRAYGTSCIHEHSCVRCPLLRVSPDQRPRLADIRDNLIARIDEARREGWTGEAEGLKVSLAAANAKLAQVDGLAARRNAAVSLGIPAFRDIAGRTAAPAKDPT